MNELREIMEAATSGDARDAKAFDDTFNPERVRKMLGVIEAAREIAKWRHDTQELDAALAALDTQDTEQGEGAGERRIRCCGRRDNCQRDALPGSDYCGPCQDARAEQNTDEQGER